MQDIQDIQAGIVGFGLAGQIFHAAVMDETPGFAVAGIVTRSGKLPSDRYASAKVFTSLDAMLADPAIQLCVVATPNDTHRSMAEQCLRSGRHVVVDKPLTLASADAEALAHIAREEGLILSAYQNRRWDGDFCTISDLLESGRIGDPFLLESHFDRFRMEQRPGAWREEEAFGGGILFDLGPHLIDQALALFGAPTSLWAEVRAVRLDSKVDDTFDIQLTYENSTRSSLHPLRVWLRTTMVAASPGARFTLHGSNGSYEKWGLDPQENALKAGGRFSDAGFGTEPAGAWGLFTAPGKPPERVETRKGDYRRYYANVRDAILGTGKLEVTIGAAWSTARIIELARESSRQGCRIPVDLSLAQTL